MPRRRSQRATATNGETRQVSLAFMTPVPRAARAPDLVAPARGQVPVPRRPKHVIRIPRSATQIELPLDPGNFFVDEGARQGLQRRLQQHLAAPVLLSVTDNRQTMISYRKSTGVLRIRLHHMFLDADVPVVEALARYIGRRRDRRASLLIGRYIEDNRIRIRPVLPQQRAHRTAGTHHDLAAVLSHVNRRYFGGDLDVGITWGRRAPVGRRRRSIKMGTYSHDERLIRIHPAMDRPFVPRYFVEYLIFHEVLHHVLPTPMVGGRALFHSPEFRARERTFPHFQRVLAWEQKHLSRLLRG